MANEEGVSWFFQLIDRITGPATQMDRSLSTIESSLKRVDQAATKTSGGGVLRVGEALRKVFGPEAEGAFFKGLAGIRDTLQRVDKIIPLDALKAAGGVMMSGASALFNVVGSIVEAGAAVAAGVAVTVAGLVAAGYRFAMESADARRNILFSLSAAVGDDAAGTQLLEELETYAKRTGLAKDTVTSSIRQLLGAGFDKSETKQLVGALSDVQAMNGGDAAATQAMLGQLVRLKTMPKVSTRELFAFGQLGLSSDAIYSAVAAQKNVTVKQAKALFDAGEVNTNEALNAILTAIRTKAGGKLGALGEKFEMGSLTAQVQHIKDAFGDLFEGVNMKPVTDFLGRLSAAMSDPAVVERFGGAVNKAFAAISSLFSGISGGDLKGTLLKIADGFSSAVDWTVRFFTAVKSGWGEASGPLSEAFDMLSKAMGFGAGQEMSGVEETFKMIGEGIAGAIKVVAIVVEINRAISEFVAAGVNLVEGLWQGITSAWAGMMAKFHGLVEMLPASVKKILGIASPSKVFAELGAYTAEGFTVGLDAGGINDAMQGAVAPPSPSIVDRGALAGLGGKSGGVQLDVKFEINLDGKGKDAEHQAEMIREEMRRVILPELLTAFEQAQAEVGG
jgi:hypothetical protein